MKLSARPKRFIVIPKWGAAGAIPQPARLMRLMQLAAPAAKTFASASVVHAAGNVAAVVNRSPADGALLIEPTDHVSLSRLKDRMPPGTQVLQEQWYRLERPARPWRKLSVTLTKPRIRAGRAKTWSVTVVLGDGTRRRLRDALVTVMTDEAKGIGIEAATNRRGKASFVLSDTTKKLDAIYVDPLHSGWPLRMADAAVVRGGIEIAVVPLDSEAPDVRGMVYGKPKAGAGQSVRVAVVDTGVGPHDALRPAGGRNTTTAESAQRFRDEDGHGSHVAGVIAATSSGWRRGEASGAELFAYRIFEAGDDYASTFAISAAIKQAAVDGCDLINLSIGDSMADDSVRDAVEFAWSRGSVCIAATGNDGKGRVDYPARYAQAVAVSAIGLVGSWPVGAYFDWTLSSARGKRLADRPTFFASFSNRGKKVALTAPGVAVVSTIFGNRWGVMSGTSMATPIATGVLARRLAHTPGVRDMARGEARARAIVALAEQAAEGLRLPAGLQGKGLAR